MEIDLADMDLSEDLAVEPSAAAPTAAANDALAQWINEALEIGSDIYGSLDNFDPAGATIFDIETGPQSLAELESQGIAFDESEVKYGNAKAEDKRQKIRDEAKARWEEQLALHAETFELLTVGIKQPGKQAILLFDDLDETHLLNRFWDLVDEAHHAGGSFIGASIFRFDLPELVRRSWILDIVVPDFVRPKKSYGNYGWNPMFVDLASEWQLGDRQASCNVNVMAAALQTPRKADAVVTGKDFHLFWRDHAKRHLAVEYAIGDLVAEEWIARRMGQL